jgi:hypothetical protein
MLLQSSATALVSGVSKPRCLRTIEGFILTFGASTKVGQGHLLFPWSCLIRGYLQSVRGDRPGKGSDHHGRTLKLRRFRFLPTVG